jgi:hypothetical protein
MRWILRGSPPLVIASDSEAIQNAWRCIFIWVSPHFAAI